MTRKFVLVAAVVFLSSFSAFAQTTVSMIGKVEMLQADGTRVPVEGATVDIFRSDAKQAKPVLSAKTNKKGEFNFAGVMLGSNYSVAASAPNAAPAFVANVPAGADKLVVVLTPGDGKRFANSAELVQSTGGGTDLKPTKTPASGEKQYSDAEIKKIQEDDAKKIAEVTTKNKKIENAKAIWEAASKEGQAALNSKDWNLAAAKYEEAYQAEPDYWGTSPIFLRNKAIALRSRGIDKFNSAKEKAPEERKAVYADAGKDFQGAVDALQKALDVYKQAESASQKPTDANQLKNFETNRYAVLADRADSYRLLVKTDAGKAGDGLTAYNEYLAVETDAALKSKAQFIAADMAMESGDLLLAVNEFRKIVESQPDNTKAIYKLGISLIGQAANTNDKTMFQEGVNYLQKFVDTAPDTDQEKAYAKATIDEMKAQQNVAPQKGAVKTGTKKGKN